MFIFSMTKHSFAAYKMPKSLTAWQVAMSVASIHGATIRN